MPDNFDSTVKFTPQGLVAGYWNEQNKVYVPYLVKKPMSNLRKLCKIEGATLRDVMSYVRKNKELSTFLSTYSWCNIEAWNAILDDPAHDSDDEDEIHYHQISWEIEIHDYGMEICTHLSMIGEISQSTREMCPDLDPSITTERYAYGGQLTDVLDLPVILDEKVDIILWDDTERSSLNQTTRDFSLLEILDAIYWEISFYGSPSATKEVFEDLAEQVSDIKEGLASGEVQIISIEPITDEEETFEDFGERLEREFQENHQEDHCPKCKKFEGREMRNYNFTKKSGDICCRECGTVVGQFLGYDMPDNPEDKDEDDDDN